MADCFKGIKYITLQPHDEDVVYTFTFEVESAAGNDGSVPFGETLAATPGGADVTIEKHPEGVDYTTEIIVTVANTNPAAADQVVSVTMRYPYAALLSAIEALGSVDIDVASTAQMEEGDIVGIELDTDDIHWTTIDSITDATTFVIADALPSAAAIGNRVLIPRIVRGIYHLRLICHWSGGGDKEFDFNRVFVRDV